MAFLILGEIVCDDPKCVAWSARVAPGPARAPTTAKWHMDPGGPFLEWQPPPGWSVTAEGQFCPQCSARARAWAQTQQAQQEGRKP